MEEHTFSTPNPSQDGKQPQKQKSSTVIILVILLALTTGGLIHMFLKNKESAEQNDLLQQQRDEAYEELDAMSSELDAKIAEITQLGGKIDTLLKIKEQLRQEKASLRQKTYKQIEALKDRVGGYKALLLAQDKEIARLKATNATLMSENTELKTTANQLNTSIKNLNESQTKLEAKVALAARLKAQNLVVRAVNARGKLRDSPFKNRHIDQLKIEFEILENRVAPIEGKDILIQITAPDSQVLFDVASGSGAFTFEGREQFYTAKQDILFDRKSKTLTFMYKNASDYAKGEYRVAVYTDGYKMGEGSFVVK